MDESYWNATYVKGSHPDRSPPGSECFGSEEPLGPTHDEMAKNVGESRIPVPRAARPSFFPKSRVLGTPTLVPGHRRSLVLSGCLQFVDAEDESSPKTKCMPRAVSTPAIEDSGRKTFTKSPVWDIDKDDMQQLVHFAEEKSNFLSLLDDTGENCLLDASLGSYNENAVNATPHYLMLNKQNSFEHDESLGILTPDQMTDFTVALECSRTPSCENLTGSAGSRLALTRASASRPSVDVEPTEEGSSERTPSPEELPLDPKPVEPVRGTGVPISFVTSVTSITSLEAGYQGDGENSRPASRGADPPSVAPPPNLPAPCRQDPMTDSDFFTESDADAYEEIVRGDRKAQVIDGTLFCAPGGRRCPSFTGEEMDSSGIYSDLDKRHDELLAPEETVEKNEDHTPDTIDTEVSQRSQPSPVHAEVIMDYLQVAVNPLDASGESNGSMNTNEVTVIEVERNNDNMRSKGQNKADAVPLKKYKMPKRNVVSKIKAMIESGPKDEAEKEARRSQRSSRKGGRWDAVMSKIEAGKNEQRTRPIRKEVKSRVLQSLGQPSATGSTQKKAGDANNNNNKDKRRIRGRQEMKSPTQETARSSVRSSLSDLSTGPGKDASKRSPTSVNPPRRLVANGRNSQQNRVNSFESKKNCVEISPINLEKSPSATRKPTITRRLTTTVPTKQHSSTTSTKDRETKEHGNNYAVTRASLETRDQAAQTDAPYETLRVKRAEQVVQALSITVQYLAYELDAFSTPKLKKDFENMKTEWMSTCSEIEELRSRNLGIEERLESERENHRRALDQLREDLEARHAEQIATLEAALQEERRRCELRLRDSLNEAAKEHRAAMVKLRAEQEAELTRKEGEFKRRSVVHDQGAALTAEVESLRSVLEIRSQENATLRSELDNIRREIEDKEALQQRAIALEARCEDLKAQLQCKEAIERQMSHDNEVLHESIHQVSKQNKRLAQRNEELQWRLRQKNEVVTVLANLTPRLSRSLGPEHVEHSLTADKNGPQSSSMVKFMVEKGDSVSWTLEIDDEFSKGASDASPTATPPKMARPEATTSVSRQGSLRLTSRRPSVDTRARSKSISVTDSARVEESAWAPTCNSTPVPRRRPRSDPSSSSSSTSSSSSSSSSAAVTTNSAVAVAVAAAAAAAAAADDCGAGQRPQEAGGEAMISEEASATSSEDESSTSSDIPPLPIQFAWGKPIK
ncbi:nucleoprotein TPR isoform X1 [Hylaeus anthracinus]|uniref:nucleoprotein TPR isoform X1 n=2 Tax=Hylaeus anthracinus TaxID=313031 RepID=UPI0023B913F3|nr:nucleoprotein TPR isoform X1 [Hylaeus anthracinus]